MVRQDNFKGEKGFWSILGSVSKFNHVLVQYSGEFPEHARNVMSIVSHQRQLGCNVIVVDTSPLVSPPVWRLADSVSRYIEKFSQDIPSKVIRDWCTEQDVTYVRAKRSEFKFLRARAEVLTRTIPNSIKDLEAMSDFENVFGMSLAAVLTSSITLRFDPKPHQYLDSLASQTWSFLAVRELFRRELSKYPGQNMVVAQGGRLPYGAGAVSAGRSKGAACYWHETGLHGFFFFEDFAPHYWEGFLRTHGGFRECLTSPERLEALREFKYGRRTDPAVNIYLSGMQSSKTNDEALMPQPAGEPDRSIKTAVIFPSSPDELTGASAVPSNYQWDHQNEALAKAIERLLELEFSVIIRLHPNLAKKPLEESRSMFRLFNKPGVKLVLPHERQNSYELLDQATVVVVGSSTIGLEALAAGKPTYYLGISHLQALTNAPLIASELALSKEAFDGYIVDSEATDDAILWATLGGRNRQCTFAPKVEDRLVRFMKFRQLIQRAILPLRVTALPWVIRRETSLWFSVVQLLAGSRRAEQFLRRVYLKGVT